MKALVLRAPGAPFALEVVPDPVAAPGEAVARVLACGAGLTIQHYKAGRTPLAYPRIIGHEITGEIVEVGAGVSGLAVGDPVTAYYYLFCGRCRMCLGNLEPLCERSGGNVGKECDGGYAEYVSLPAHNFLRLPEGLDHRAHPAEIGVISDALATPYKVNRRTRTRPGETVAVFGAGGGLGIHQILLSRWAGARVIAVDTAAGKFEACRRAGAEAVVDASRQDVVEALRELTGGRGVDVAVDYVSSSATLEQAVKALAVKGRMVTLGGAGKVFRVDAMQMLLGELDLLGSRYVTRSEVLDTLALVARGEVWPIVSEICPMAEAEALHERLERGAIVGRAALLIG
ncbi:MAG: zinc-binding dehydrogenase [Candidatus Rokubacteria bacterium]|nr:zinc-binding dehydrogenase [Candidatus Rokubacteria bacterium]